MEEKALTTSERKVEKQIKLAMIEKLKEISGLQAETLNILNNIHTDRYEDAICEIEEFINDKIYEIMENLEPEDYEEFYFDKKDAVGFYGLGLYGLGTYIFELNNEYAFMGVSNGEDIIKAQKTEIIFNEEGEPYFEFNNGYIMLDEIMRLR